MRSTTVIFLLDFFGQAHARDFVLCVVNCNADFLDKVNDKVVDKLVNRALKVLPIERADLDETTLLKTNPQKSSGHRGGMQFIRPVDPYYTPSTQPAKLPFLPLSSTPLQYYSALPLTSQNKLDPCQKGRWDSNLDDIHILPHIARQGRNPCARAPGRWDADLDEIHDQSKNENQKGFGRWDAHLDDIHDHPVWNAKRGKKCVWKSEWMWE